MKKTHFLFVALTFVMLSCSNDNPRILNNHLTEYSLKGDVKSLVEFKFNAINKFGEYLISKDFSITSTSKFDKSGNLTFESYEYPRYPHLLSSCQNEYSDGV